MSAVGVYILANVEIHDPEPYHLYEKGFFPS